MFRRKKIISVNIKLMTGLDDKKGYDPEKGMDLYLKEGLRLSKIKSKLQIPKKLPVAFMINGQKVEPETKLKDGDEVFCYLPFAGG